MNTKLIYIALMLYALCYALLFGTWAAIVFNKTPGADQIVTYIQIGLGTLSGHVLTLLGPRAGAGALWSPPAPAGQGGFARVGVMAMMAVVAVVALMATGCATAPGAPKQTPQQIAAQVCPAVQITVADLLVLHGLSTEAHDALTNAAPIVDAVCSGVQTVDMASLKRMADTALPMLIKIADAAPLQPSVHDQVIMGLTVGQIVLEGALQAAGAQPGPAAGAPK